jgi:hypothetical protein
VSCALIVTLVFLKASRVGLSYQKDNSKKREAHQYVWGI